MQIIQFILSEVSFAGATAQFIEDIAGTLAFALFGDMDIITIASIAIAIGAAERIALIAFATFGVSTIGNLVHLVCRLGEIGCSFSQRLCCALLFLLSGFQVTVAQGLCGAFLSGAGFGHAIAIAL